MGAALHQVLSERLGQADQIEWERASLDSASIPAKAKRGGAKTAKNPTDKGKAGSKCHLVSEREEASRSGADAYSAANVSSTILYGFRGGVDRRHRESPSSVLVG